MLKQCLLLFNAVRVIRNICQAVLLNYIFRVIDYLNHSKIGVINVEAIIVDIREHYHLIIKFLFYSVGLRLLTIITESIVIFFNHLLNQF